MSDNPVEEDYFTGEEEGGEEISEKINEPIKGAPPWEGPPPHPPQ